MHDVRILTIYLHNQKIGTLTLLSNQQTIFSFDDNYIRNPNRPTLSLSFENRNGDFIPTVKPTRVQIPPFFSNLLPEGPLRNYLAQHAGINAKREFFLLWALGEDLPGTVTVKAEDPHHWPLLPIQQSETEKSKDFMRFSLAGVQLKFSGIMEPLGGLTIPAKGIGGSWIVKLPSFQYEGVPENEFSMMTLARMIGMDIPEIQLVPLEKISGLPTDLGKLQGDALAVKRFDRTGDGEKVHMEDFTQVFNIYPDHKYDRANYKNIAEIIGMRMGIEGIAEYIRRLVFNTLIGNADMHLKNWSLIYPNKREPQLAPGYDFLSTIPYISDETMALRFIKTKNMTDLSLQLLSDLSAKALLPENLVLKTAKETVALFREIWEREKTHFPINKATIDIISKNAQKIKLYQQG